MKGQVLFDVTGAACSETCFLPPATDCVTAVARTADGKPVDYTRTKFAGAVKDGVFDDWLCALLERDGTMWKVTALEIGATDVPYVDWSGRFVVPRDLVLAR